MISPNVAAAFALIACAGAIALGGLHYSSRPGGDPAEAWSDNFPIDDYAWFFLLDTVVWDRTMPHAARRHYMVFLSTRASLYACMLGVGLLRRP